MSPIRVTAVIVSLLISNLTAQEIPSLKEQNTMPIEDAFNRGDIVLGVGFFVVPLVDILDKDFTSLSVSSQVGVTNWLSVGATVNYNKSTKFTISDFDTELTARTLTADSDIHFRGFPNRKKLRTSSTVFDPSFGVQIGATFNNEHTQYTVEAKDRSYKNVYFNPRFSATWHFKQKMGISTSIGLKEVRIVDFSCRIPAKRFRDGRK